MWQQFLGNCCHAKLRTPPMHIANITAADCAQCAAELKPSAEWAARPCHIGGQWVSDNNALPATPWALPATPFHGMSNFKLS